MKKIWPLLIVTLSQLWASGCETITEQKDLTQNHAKVTNGEVKISIRTKVQPGMSIDQLRAQSKENLQRVMQVKEVLKPLQWKLANEKAKAMLSSEQNESARLYISAYMLKYKLMPEQESTVKNDLLFHVQKLVDSETPSIETYAPALQRLHELDSNLDVQSYAQKGIKAYQLANKCENCSLGVENSSELRMLEALAK
ncbi:MAG: hypothetical protein J0L94_16760 [Rhodothermia bacterium]|nr:hypothetical protein [Rhodothermia bacterium]